MDDTRCAECQVTFAEAVPPNVWRIRGMGPAVCEPCFQWCQGGVSAEHSCAVCEDAITGLTSELTSTA
jgi:hypothetical protein